MRNQHTIQFVHRLSASLLAAFLFAHIANHLAALHSAEAHQEFMAVARRVYRATFFDLLWDLLEQFEPEDGLIWVYDIGDMEVPAFTDFGLDNLREIIAD